MLAAGRLKERISIRRLEDVSDAKGGYTRDWVAFAADIPAEVINQSGREALIASAMQSVASYRITIRKRSGIEFSDQILWGDVELNIRSAGDDPFNPRDATVIFADTGSPQNVA